MGALATDPTPVRLTSFGARLLLLGAALGSLTVFSALVPWEIGVWPRFEAGGMGLFFAAGVCAVALVLIWFQDRRIVDAALGHPLVLAAFAIAVSGGIFAFFVDYPWLSIFGYPLIGEGALRYGAMGILIAAAIVLRHDAQLFRGLLVVLLVGSIGGTLVLHVWSRGEFVSLDMAGFLVVSAWVSAWYLQPSEWRVGRFAICGLAVTPILYVATNDTAIVATLAIGLPASLLVYLNAQRSLVSDRTVRVMAFCAVVAIPFAAMLAVWVAPMLTDALPSITSRKYMYQLLFAALRADPAIILAGQGWGEIVMTMDNFRTASDAVMWDGSWDGATRDLPHSHSLLLESLFGGGVLAVLALLAVLAVPVLTCDQRDLPVVVFAVFVFAALAAIWPQVAMTVAPVSLALGLASAGPAGRPAALAAGRGMAMILPVAVVALLGSGIWLSAQGLQYQRSVADVRENGVRSEQACNLLPKSAVYGDLDLIKGLIATYWPVFKAAQSGARATAAEHRLIAAYLCAAEQRALQSASPSLHVGLEIFRAQVSSDAGRTPDIVRYRDSLAEWPGKLVRLINAAPNRTDLTMVFLTARMQAQAWQSVGSLSRALLDLNPADPVANWFLGQYLLSKGDQASRAAGFQALTLSLDNGIKRLFQVPEDFERDIRNATGRGR